MAEWGVGSELAGYRLDHELGRGGMGVVYRATQLRLKRAVAVKLLSTSLAADEGYRRRFEREAALAAALDHPHVIPVYDAGLVDGVLFLSMRFVDGVNLGSMLGSGPLDLYRTCELLAPVADALDAAHTAGLVHRDVKPGNILVANTNGHVYLCDFGIAKGTATETSSLTGTGAFLGTATYSAPEQIQGGTVDGRADQYSLACVAYRCLTGRPPFVHDDLLALMFAHITAEPPRAGISDRLDDTLTRGLAKQPDDRFPDCRTFIAALRDTAAQPTEQPAVERPVRAVGPADDTVDQPVKPVTGRPVRTVGLTGTADHRTIIDAIQAARPGDRIVVQPGVYRGGLVVDTDDLEIVAATSPDGAAGEVVVEAAGASALWFRAGTGRVAGLLLRQLGGGTWYGIDVSTGHLQVDTCDVSSRGLACIAVHNGASAHILGCRLHDGKNCGIYVYDQGGGLIENNEITANALAGIILRTAGSPTIRASRIHHGRNAGISIYDQGEGLIEDNEITANTNAGIGVATGGNPTVVGNRIARNAGSGVSVYDGGGGRYRGNTLEGNGEPQFDIAPDCRARVILE